MPLTVIISLTFTMNVVRTYVLEMLRLHKQNTKISVPLGVVPERRFFSNSMFETAGHAYARLQWAHSKKTILKGQSATDKWIAKTQQTLETKQPEMHASQTILGLVYAKNSLKYISEEWEGKKQPFAHTEDWNFGEFIGNKLRARKCLVSLSLSVCFFFV